MLKAALILDGEAVGAAGAYPACRAVGRFRAFGQAEIELDRDLQVRGRRVLRRQIEHVQFAQRDLALGNPEVVDQQATAGRVCQHELPEQLMVVAQAIVTALIHGGLERVGRLLQRHQPAVADAVIL